MLIKFFSALLPKLMHTLLHLFGEGFTLLNMGAKTGVLYFFIATLSDLPSQQHFFTGKEESGGRRD